MYNKQLLQDYLQETAQTLKECILHTNKKNKLLLAQTYNATLLVLNELNKQDNIEQNNASDILIAYELLNENQVKHKSNKGFIDLCNSFINDYGSDKFNRILDRVKKYQQEKQIKNIYAFITQSINNAKRGVK